MLTSLLTPTEVGAILRYRPGQVVRLASSGKIPHVTLPDGQIRIAESTVKQIIEAGREGRPR